MSHEYYKRILYLGWYTHVTEKKIAIPIFVFLFLFFGFFCACFHIFSHFYVLSFHGFSWLRVLMCKSWVVCRQSGFCVKLTFEAIDSHPAGLIEAFLAVTLVLIQHEPVAHDRQALRGREHKQESRSQGTAERPLKKSPFFLIPIWESCLHRLLFFLNNTQPAPTEANTVTIDGLGLRQKTSCLIFITSGRQKEVGQD